MKYRDFIYAGEPNPEITEQEYAAFYQLFQTSILASLQRRGLLTQRQYELCVEETEKQYRKTVNRQA